MRKSLYKEGLQIAEFQALITCRSVSVHSFGGLATSVQVCTKRRAEPGGPRSHPGMGEVWHGVHTYSQIVPAPPPPAFRLQSSAVHPAL